MFTPGLYRSNLQPAATPSFTRSSVHSQLIYSGTNVAINSNVLVTVQRYWSDIYVEEQGPILQTPRRRSW